MILVSVMPLYTENDSDEVVVKILIIKLPLMAAVR